MYLFNLCRVPPGACGCRPKRPKPRDQGPVQRRGRVTARPVFARSFFLAESDPAVLLSCQIFLHAEQIALAGTLNNPQQLSHRGDLLQLLLNEPLKEIVGRIIGLSLCHDSEGRSANARRSGPDFERLAPEVRDPSQSQAYRRGAGGRRSASDRYITGRFLPDKAIDVMDEAGARARINSMTRPPDGKEIEQTIETIRAEKEAAIKAQDYEKAGALRDSELHTKDKLERILNGWREQRDEREVIVTGDDIMHIVSKWTGVPLNRMEQKEAQKLLNMAEELKEQVIGQDEAVIAVSKALRGSRADLKDPRRPIGSFIFLGPTGVGKTFLARTLAEFMFGDGDALIQIDMSEYMEKFTASRLIGSPPGYVGYEEGGQLSEAVRRRPYAVVLFDEIEKAHPDVMHLLLQILEEGKITDSLGQKIDFRNTIIIMTSNVGAELIKRQTALGFGAIAGHGSYEAMRNKILEESKRVFRPEFLSRLDYMIVFHQLGRHDLAKIVDLEVAKVTERIRAKDIKVHLDRTAVEFLIDKGYDPIYGARPMRRAVEKYLEDPLAEELLRGNIKQGDTLEVHAAGEQLAFKVTVAGAK